ncbi:hypothetical protein C7M84_006625 [Penaeus vannamei]|uniref:Organic cation transporter protein n=1 Tax=Penaeus vannamei TaxID=6689 RepID=A0A3R7PRN4_PENVA|nr:hypothetical protein C7M84_006625 [Penaeus vannamei]
MKSFSLTTYHTLGGAFLAPRVDYTAAGPRAPTTQLPPEAPHRCSFPGATTPPKRLNHSSASVSSHRVTHQRRTKPPLTELPPPTLSPRPECSYFVLNSSSGQVEEEPCVEWDFDNSTFSSTVGTEFQLACGWEYLRSTYQSIYMFGVTIGAPFNGVLADRYGRKMTVAVGFVAYSALAIGSCWIPNLSALLLSRFLMGAVHPTIQKTGYILGAAPARPPSAAEGRQVERGRPPPEDELLLLLKDGAMVRPHQTPAPTRERLVQKALYTNYLLVGAVYFGLSLSGGDLSSDPFLYMVLTGVVELPAYTLVIPLVARYGRRAPVVAFFFMGAVALLALPFVPTVSSGESMTLALMGKMSIASAFQILDFYSSELFPTEEPLVPVGGRQHVFRGGVRCSGWPRSPAGDGCTCLLPEQAAPHTWRKTGDQDQRNSVSAQAFTLELFFQLACGWEYLRSTYQSIYMFGVTIGAPFNGVLADRYGRKMTMAVGFVAYSALAIGSCWIPNLSALLLSRFLMGAVDPTILKTGYILGMEVADPKWRMHIGIALFLPWALSLMAWGGFAYLVREWRMLQLTVSLLCLAFLPTLWFMDESPRWLAVRGQHRRALRVLQRAARWNGVALPPEDELLLLLKDGVKDEAMVRPHQDARAHTARGCGGDLSSDPFLYMVLTGVVELPAYTLVIPLVARYGRRAPVVAFFFMGAVALLALPFVPTDPRLLLLRALSTEVRTRGMSTALVMSRGPLYPWAPSAVFGAASVLAGWPLALPETLHVPLPDTIAHLEEREIRTSGFLRLPVRDPRIPTIYVSQGFHSKGGDSLQGDSTPRGLLGIPLRGFHSKGIPLPLQGEGIPLQGDSTPRGGDSTPGIPGDSTPRGFHSKGIPLQGIPLHSTPGDSTPRGFHSKGIPLQGIPLRGFHSKGFHFKGIPLLGDSTPRGFHSKGIPLLGDSTPRGFHS